MLEWSLFNWSAPVLISWSRKTAVSPSALSRHRRRDLLCDVLGRRRRRRQSSLRPLQRGRDVCGGNRRGSCYFDPTNGLVDRLSGLVLLSLGWGEPGLGLSCEAAVPAVVDNSLLLRIGGIPFSGQTDVGDTVDGSAFGTCRTLSEGTAQAVLGVPFGPAEFTVSGRDSLSELSYEQTFETFVGAGTGNPELRFDVAPVAVPDAGPDAAPNAM